MWTTFFLNIKKYLRNFFVFLFLFLDKSRIELEKERSAKEEVLLMIYCQYNGLKERHKITTTWLLLSFIVAMHFAYIDNDYDL